MHHACTYCRESEWCKKWEMIDFVIIAKKDAKSSKSRASKCSFAALFSLLQLPIASGLVQS